MSIKNGNKNAMSNLESVYIYNEDYSAWFKMSIWFYNTYHTGLERIRNYYWSRTGMRYELPITFDMLMDLHVQVLKINNDYIHNMALTYLRKCRSELKPYDIDILFRKNANIIDISTILQKDIELIKKDLFTDKETLYNTIHSTLYLIPTDVIKIINGYFYY